VTSWNGVLEFELDRLGVPKLSDSFILINETITEKFNTTKTVLKNNTAEENKDEFEIP